MHKIQQFFNQTISELKLKINTKKNPSSGAQVMTSAAFEIQNKGDNETDVAILGETDSSPRTTTPNKTEEVSALAPLPIACDTIKEPPMLPIEVILLVIEYLDPNNLGDKNTLRSLRLVNSTLSPIATQLLFDTIQVSGHHEIASAQLNRLNKAKHALPFVRCVALPLPSLIGIAREFVDRPALGPIGARHHYCELGRRCSQLVKAFLEGGDYKKVHEDFFFLLAALPNRHRLREIKVSRVDDDGRVPQDSLFEFHLSECVFMLANLLAHVKDLAVETLRVGVKDTWMVAKWDIDKIRSTLAPPITKDPLDNLREERVLEPSICCRYCDTATVTLPAGWLSSVVSLELTGIITFYLPLRRAMAGCTSLAEFKMSSVELLIVPWKECKCEDEVPDDVKADPRCWGGVFQQCTTSMERLVEFYFDELFYGDRWHTSDVPEEQHALFTRDDARCITTLTDRVKARRLEKGLPESEALKAAKFPVKQYRTKRSVFLYDHGNHLKREREVGGHVER